MVLWSTKSFKKFYHKTENTANCTFLHWKAVIKKPGVRFLMFQPTAHQQPELGNWCLVICLHVLPFTGHETGCTSGGGDAEGCDALMLDGIPSLRVWHADGGKGKVLLKHSYHALQIHSAVNEDRLSSREICRIAVSSMHHFWKMLKHDFGQLCVLVFFWSCTQKRLDWICFPLLREYKRCPWYILTKIMK